jgi:hypothetical protein
MSTNFMKISESQVSSVHSFGFVMSVRYSLTYALYICKVDCLDFIWALGRVKDEKSQLGITAICFFGTILHGETEFTALLMF